MTGHVQPQKRSTTTLSACIFNPWKSIFVKNDERSQRAKQEPEDRISGEHAVGCTSKTSSQKTFLA